MQLRGKFLSSPFLIKIAPPYTNGGATVFPIFLSAAKYLFREMALRVLSMGPWVSLNLLQGVCKIKTTYVIMLRCKPFHHVDVCTDDAQALLDWNCWSLSVKQGRGANCSRSRRVLLCHVLATEKEKVPVSLKKVQQN